jgi:NAD(P)-dependent dehydrogenase (short-subunit alcohol dehydrogenase family)
MNVQITPARMGAMRDLHGKVSLVTGSTSGIGLGIARALAEAGSRIVLNGPGSPAQVAEVRASFAKDFGVPASYSAADMTEPDAISRMIADMVEEHGRLDILVNNAGIQHVAPIHSSPPKNGTRSLRSTFPRRSTASRRPSRRCGAMGSGGSSTSHRRMVWSARRSRQPTLPRSTASSG